MIETNRLLIVPMTENEISDSIESGIFSDEHLKEAMIQCLQMVSRHEEQFMWYTNWNIYLHETGFMIGGIMVKGEPNEQGEVEIGYGINPLYQNRGYMTEAVSALNNWIFTNKEVKCIVAETDRTNIASHRVLINNGFQEYKKTDSELWWRLEYDANH